MSLIRRKDVCSHVGRGAYCQGYALLRQMLHKTLVIYGSHPMAYYPLHTWDLQGISDGLRTKHLPCMCCQAQATVPRQSKHIGKLSWREEVRSPSEGYSHYALTPEGYHILEDRCARLPAIAADRTQDPLQLDSRMAGLVFQTSPDVSKPDSGFHMPVDREGDLRVDQVLRLEFLQKPRISLLKSEAVRTWHPRKTYVATNCSKLPIRSSSETSSTGR